MKELDHKAGYCTFKARVADAHAASAEKIGDDKRAAEWREEAAWLRSCPCAQEKIS